MVGHQDSIEQLFQQSKGRWRGCDWVTHFGPMGLNLEGLKASQARIMAMATSGIESTQWLLASQWLQDLETDAILAEREANQAMHLIHSSQWQPAFEHLQRAYLLEQKYRPSRIWLPLYQAVYSMYHAISHCKN